MAIHVGANPRACARCFCSCWSYPRLPALWLEAGQMLQPISPSPSTYSCYSRAKNESTRERGALNSFSLVSFYPSSSPQRALALVIQTWRDDRLPTSDLRREVRKVGDALVEQFKAMAGHPLVLKRWRTANPQSNIVVRHVRVSDLRETLAVTTNGETLFDEESIARAKRDVVSRGAVWSW